MKKIIFALAALTLFSGCAKEELPQDTATPVTSLNVSEEYKKIEKTDNISHDCLNKYQDCYYDFDTDGVEEAVTLYTSAEKDENGEFMWDDSQDWLLTVEGNNGNYILCDSHTHGKLDLFVSENYGSNGEITPSIRLVVSAGSGFEIKEYTYSDGNFFEQTVYNAGDLNELPVYQY